MISKSHFMIKRAAAIGYSLGAVCLIVGILLTVFNLPANAASVREEDCKRTKTPAIPTETQVIIPTATNTKDIPPTETPVTPTATHTPVPPDTATATSPIEVLPPVPSETTAPTATTTNVAPEIISPTEQTSTALPETPATPTATDHPRKPRPTATTYAQPVAAWTPSTPATLPPPSAPTQQGQKPALIPQTGADLTSENNTGRLPAGVFLRLGIGLLGLGLVFHGISSKNR